LSVGYQRILDKRTAACWTEGWHNIEPEDGRNRTGVQHNSGRSSTKNIIGQEDGRIFDSGATDYCKGEQRVDRRTSTE
jgi:hypothetical protein